MGEKERGGTFVSLARTIVGQQLSGKAARAIWKKVEMLFPRRTPTPKKVLSFSDDTLRGAGLSFGKIKALKALAHAYERRKVPKDLSNLKNEEIYSILTDIHGIGPWTVEMFLMFTLRREDIFSPGDLGLRKGIQITHRTKTLPSPKEAEQIAEKWAPFRTYASLVLWKSVDS